MTDWEVRRMLDEARIGRLCMAGRDGRPYVIPLPFCFADGTVYVRVPMKGRKGEILAENAWVCFEVDAYSSSLDEYASVLVEGELVEVADLEEKRRVKAWNDEKYARLRGGYRPGHGRGTPLEEVPMRKVRVSRISGRKKGNDVGQKVGVR
jgi:nitroimidazol reductase NimA-like FMN-containing flavoprotein (pyridoxamine 5'-phosphate oxidase superfamily)